MLPLIVLALAACGSRAPVAPEGGADAGPMVEAPVIDAGAAADAGDAGADEARYDLVLAGGRVIDPASGRDAILDVAIAGGRIAKIAPAIDRARAAKVVDVKGLMVVPGLVDLHVHVFHGDEKNNYLSRTNLAVQADEVAPRSCTTTVVDAGSSGHRTFPVFEAEVIRRSQTRVLAFLNIVGWGMRGGKFEQDVGDMDASATAAAIRAHKDEIVGVKVAHYAGPGWEPIDRAVEATTRAGGHVMVDFGGHVPELSLEELLLHRMRPRDILTHLYADVRGRTAVVDARGMVHPYLKPAHDRGIVFDLGYGGASFVFSQAVPAIAQGLLPDTLSTDMHRSSTHGSMRDLVHVISKLAALGMTIPDLIRRATAAPADAIDRPDLGRLAEGAEADVAVLGLSTGHFVFTDTKKEQREGTQQLSCELTLRAGKVVFDPAGRAAR